MTVQDLINGSLRLLGVLANGEVPAAQESTDAFNALNGMVDSWSNESLIVYSSVREVFPLVQGQQVYTMGVGGNFSTSRPQDIQNALIIPQTSPTIEMPMRIVNQDEFADIRVKATTSTIPMWIYVDDAYPLANINVWPVPQGTPQIVLYSWKPLSDFAATTTTLSVPPGYVRALRYNLAIELAPEYGKQVDPLVVAIAVESKEVIKRMNIEALYMSTDDALSGPKGSFNWLTGDTV